MVVSTLHVFGFVLSLVLLLVWCLIAECLLMPVWFIWFGGLFGRLVVTFV